MKYSRRKDRATRWAISHTPKYESKKSIEKRFRVNEIVQKFARGLGAVEEEDIIGKYYIQSHVPPRDILTELRGYGEEEDIIGKYYIQSHVPPRDILTELRGTEKPKPSNFLVLLAVVVGLIWFSQS
jgi:hypothetical protein